jgi:hypothetical protein
MFQALAEADRPLRADEISASIGETDAGPAHSMLRDLRAKHIELIRYHDPKGASPSSSVYSLRPVEGYRELRTQTKPRNPKPSAASPPTPIRPGVRQPLVGSVARVTALSLEGDELRARFECDNTVYIGTVGAAQPVIGEWLTVVTVGLHGQGLYVDLAGGRVVTIENLTEEDNGR